MNGLAPRIHFTAQDGRRNEPPPAPFRAETRFSHEYILISLYVVFRDVTPETRIGLADFFLTPQRTTPEAIHGLTRPGIGRSDTPSEKSIANYPATRSEKKDRPRMGLYLVDREQHKFQAGGTGVSPVLGPRPARLRCALCVIMAIRNHRNQCSNSLPRSRSSPTSLNLTSSRSNLPQSRSSPISSPFYRYSRPCHRVGGHLSIRLSPSTRERIFSHITCEGISSTTEAQAKKQQREKLRSLTAGRVLHLLSELFAGIRSVRG
jgi:hypothetical protein